MYIININYLGNVVGESPDDKETNAMSSEESHEDVTKPYVVLDATL